MKSYFGLQWCIIFFLTAKFMTSTRAERFSLTYMICLNQQHNQRAKGFVFLVCRRENLNMMEFLRSLVEIEVVVKSFMFLQSSVAPEIWYTANARL